MGILMFILLGFSLLLILVSFFQKDPIKELKEEMDQLTLQQVQELYQIKKKIKILEEELLLSSVDFSPGLPLKNNQKEIHDIIKNQVWALAQQGKPIEQIAISASLSQDEVFTILQEYADRGKRNE